MVTAAQIVWIPIVRMIQHALRAALRCLTLGDEDGDGLADCLDTIVTVLLDMMHLET